MSKFLTVKESFHFLGQVDFRVISGGTISVNGYKISSNAPCDGYKRAFSPRSNALMFVELVDIQTEVILEVKPVENGLEALQTCQPTFNNLLTLSPEELATGNFDEFVPGFYILTGKAKDFQEIPLMRIPEDWTEVLEDLTAKNSNKNNTDDDSKITPVVFVCGHRKVGKSSFSRFIANGLLNEAEAVEFIDLDPGQTEFTPAGFVSRKRIKEPFLGPPFTHLNVPDDAVYLGTSNGSESPFIYCRAMQKIRLNFNYKPGIPVVINTMGWMTGLGLELIINALQIFKPTHVLAFMTPENNEDTIRKCLTSNSFGSNGAALTSEEAENIYVRYMGNPVCDGPRAKHSPADQRNLAYWTYFFGIFNENESVIDRFNFNSQLSALRPVIVPLANVQLLNTSREFDLFDLIKTRDNCDRFRLLESWLLMRVVGFAFDEKFTRCGRWINLIPNGKVSRVADMKCSGVGLVRSIVRISDTRVHLHLLTPLPLSILSKTNTLILGSLQLPLPLISADSLSLKSEAPGFSTQMVGTDVNGSGARKTRHNMRRR